MGTHLVIKLQGPPQFLLAAVLTLWAEFPYGQPTPHCCTQCPLGAQHLQQGPGSAETGFSEPGMVN